MSIVYQASPTTDTAVTQNDTTVPSASSPNSPSAHHIVEMIDNYCLEHAITEHQSVSSASLLDAGRLTLKHHIFKDGEWKSRLAKPHPMVTITLTINYSDYEQFKIRNPPALHHETKAVTDSGAQCCVWGWRNCQSAGITRGSLIPVKQKLNGVDKSRITIYGALIIRLHGVSSTGEEFSAAAIVYVSPDITGFYMSEDVMKQLCIIPPGFPAIGGALNSTRPHCINEVFSVEPKCPCLPRTAPPERPDQLPMDATEDNIPAMEAYLLERYKGSVFNQCIHQPAPKMSGPPMRIHVDPNAEGKVVTTPP